MNELYNLFGIYIIPGIFFSVLTIMLASVIFRTYDSRIAYSIIRWILILYPAIYILSVIYDLVISWYSGVEYEQYVFLSRAGGSYWWAYWSMIACGIFPLLLLSRRAAQYRWFILICSLLINIGSTVELFVIHFRHPYLTAGDLIAPANGVLVGIIVILIGYCLKRFTLKKNTEQ